MSYEAHLKELCTIWLQLNGESEKSGIIEVGGMGRLNTDDVHNESILYVAVMMGMLTYG